MPTPADPGRSDPRVTVTQFAQGYPETWPGRSALASVTRPFDQAPEPVGFNRDGGVGDGTTTNKSTPVAVAGGLTFTAISAGGNHTCGTTSTGAAYCWGSNTHSEVGDGTIVNRLAPVRVMNPR